MQKLPLMAITMGDPCGVGPEIIIKALQTPEIRGNCVPFVIGDRLAMGRALSVCASPLKTHEIALPEEARTVPDGTIPLLALSQLAEPDLLYGNPSVAAGDSAYRYICHAARLCLEGQAAAMITAPISKETMNRAGHDYPGHTELLAELCGTSNFVMMLAGDLLRVSLVTIHEALSDVPRLVTFEQVLKTICITAEGVRRLTGKAAPKLAVLALNPHCGEGGMFGDEENNIIGPAIKKARSLGINAEGPLSADTLFHFILKNHAESNSTAVDEEETMHAPMRLGVFGETNELIQLNPTPLYDGVVAMYHDQGLIPFKMLHFDDGVNITLGLPIIRTSVDHGTAYNLAGTGLASEKSLLAAIRMAAKMASEKA